jgi:hypothetical protein
MVTIVPARAIIGIRIKICTVGRIRNVIGTEKDCHRPKRRVTERDEKRLTGALAVRASFLGLPRSPGLAVNIVDRKYFPCLELSGSSGAGSIFESVSFLRLGSGF